MESTADKDQILDVEEIVGGLVEEIGLEPIKEEVPLQATEDIEKEIAGALEGDDVEEIVKEETKTSENTKKQEELTESVLQQKNTTAFDKVSTLIEFGALEDVEVELEDGSKVVLSEYEDITEDQLEIIRDQQKSLKEQDTKEKYISKEGLEEDKIKVMEMLQNGADITDIFEKPEDAIRPFQGLNLEDQKDQIRIIYKHYTETIGNSQEEALAIVKGIISNNKTEELANNLHQAHNNLWEQNLDNKRQEIINKNKEKIERDKTIRKELSQTLKEANFKDTLSRKLIDSVTKRDEKGVLPIEQAFKKLLENPKENYEKILHILDEKTFNEVKKIKNSTKEGGLRIIKMLEETPTKRKSVLKKQREELDGNDLYSFVEQQVNSN